MIRGNLARVALGLGLGVGLLAACGSPAPTPSSSARPSSVVVMGDSVASGEGTLYGYQYDPTSQTWTGGNLNASWPGPYPLCHDSPDAYGYAVAAHFGAAVAQFACTGSTFSGGIAGPKFDGATEQRPAQFGNWDTRRDLNAAYDRARPNLVLITLGADDVNWTGILKACIESRFTSLLSGSPQCTAADPGSTFERDYSAVLPTLVANYKTLVRWIDQRGQADHRVPKVVFTTYYDPLPTDGASCPDTDLLASSQISFISTTFLAFDQTIKTTISGLHQRNVAVADLSQAFDGHRWCSSDPWIYGLSIFKLTDPASLLSQAPFHPTPAGQRAIAQRIEPVVTRLFSGRPA